MSRPNAARSEVTRGGVLLRHGQSAVSRIDRVCSTAVLGMPRLEVDQLGECRDATVVKIRRAAKYRFERRCDEASRGTQILASRFQRMTVREKAGNDLAELLVIAGSESHRNRTELGGRDDSTSARAFH